MEEARKPGPEKAARRQELNKKLRVREGGREGWMDGGGGGGRRKERLAFFVVFVCSCCLTRVVR